MELSFMDGPKTACVQDLPQLIHLWSLCFHENETDSAWFLSRRFVPEQTFVWRRNGKVCAVIYLIPVQAGGYRGGYLYAIGTHPDLQGQGIFGRLHQYVKEQAVAAGLHFLCLIPAEPSLFSLYGRLGYETWYGRQQISLEKLPLTAAPVSIRDCSPKEFLTTMQNDSCAMESPSSVWKNTSTVSGRRIQTDDDPICCPAADAMLLYESAADRQLVLQQHLYYEGFFKQCTVDHTTFVLAGIQEDDILYLSQCSCSQNLLLQAGAVLARTTSCNRLYMPPAAPYASAFGMSISVLPAPLQHADAPYAMGLWLVPDHAGLPAGVLGLMYT